MVGCYYGDVVLLVDSFKHWERGPRFYSASDLSPCDWALGIPMQTLRYFAVAILLRHRGDNWSNSLVIRNLGQRESFDDFRKDMLQLKVRSKYLANVFTTNVASRD